MTNVIQEQSAEQRKQRQEQIKREKESQIRAAGAAQKLKLKAFSKKPTDEEQLETNTNILSMKLKTMKGQMVGQAWSKKATAAKSKESPTPQKDKKKEKLSKTLKRERGPYNKSDPLHMCELNINCHRRNSNTPQRGCAHKLDKEEMTAKQKVNIYQGCCIRGMPKRNFAIHFKIIDNNMDFSVRFSVY